MPKYITRFFVRLSDRLPIERSIFDFSPAMPWTSAEELMEETGLNDTIQEAWRKDLENIGRDFYRALGRFERENAQ